MGLSKIITSIVTRFWTTEPKSVKIISAVFCAVIVLVNVPGWGEGLVAITGTTTGTVSWILAAAVLGMKFVKPKDVT